MYKKIGKVGASLAALAAIAVGSSAIAAAATAKKGSTMPTPPPAGQGAYGYPQGPPPSGFRGDHGGRGFPGHKAETPLTGDTAQKVKDAALAKVKGGTIERVETNTDGGGPYEAHMRKSDGSEVVVLVNKQFEATAVRTGGPGGRGGPGHYGGPPPAGSQQQPGGLQGAPPPGAPQA